MQIEKASDGIGAIASGINVAALTDADWRALKQAWLDHHVLIVRGQQDLPIDVFLDYGRRFGRVQPHPVVRSRHSEIPELTVMGIGTKKADGTFDKSVLNRGQGWHTDGPWDHTVCNATQLLGLEIPSTGGDTLFANMHMALEALPTDLRARIQGLDAHHIYGGADRKSVDLLPPEARNRPPTRYPLVRAHAETGRETLYFNPFHILKIADIPEAESDALIAELTEHMIAPGADYRHRWQTGDLVTWDNRCTLHAATGGYPIEEKRIHWRCTIMAEG